MPARQHATALVRGSSGTRATARSRSETSSMRPTPALLALVLCASIQARPWQLAHCRGPKQAKYSAAWLASSDLLRALPESYLNTSRLFKRGTMMEAASFLLLEKTATFKTRDFLDFYVEHLSWYERRLIVATNPLDQREKVLGAARRALATKLEAMTFRQKQRPLDAVAVMPFYGQGQGQGPSSVGLRGIYLNATLNSVRAALTRTVVVAVHNEQDLEFVETCIGLCGSTSRRWRGAPDI